MAESAAALRTEAETVFGQIFGGEAGTVSFAPGRVELLGNHTDYNEGYVMLAAIDRGVVLAGERSEENRCEVHSIGLGRTARFHPGDRRHDDAEPWADYVKGVLDELAKAGVPCPAFRAVIHSSVPLGSGLSSSAALEVATALFALALAGEEWDRVAIAQLCRRAENHFVGVPCGILDQFSSLFGAANSAVFLDCRTMEHEVLPLPSEPLALVVANTLTKHELVDGHYAARRQACLDATAAFAAMEPGVTALRDVSVELFESQGHQLPEMTRKRARHVVTENARVLAGRDALRRGDAEAYRAAMVSSHESSRDDFENSTPELDTLIDLARVQPGFLGGKLSGGGFGGCTVNLVEEPRVEGFERALVDGFRRRFGRRPDLVRCHAAGGARLLKTP